MTINYVELGLRIAARRKVLGLKQDTVCERCGLNSKYLSNIERARSIPSLDVLLRLCAALDTTPDYFLAGIAHCASDDCSAKPHALYQRMQSLNAKQLSLIESFIEWTITNV